MTFGAFMEKFTSRDGSWYLSAGGKKEAFGAHARALTSRLGEDDASARGLLPIRPRIVPPELILADMNLWMGRNADPTSSGLHHDYHDNVYVLARGEKRFTLYSPRDAGRMYTAGKITRVHCNGLINYNGIETGEDGDVIDEDGEPELKSRLEELEAKDVRSEDAADDDNDDDKNFDDDDFADFDGVDDYDELNESDDNVDDEDENHVHVDEEPLFTRDGQKITKDKSDPDSFSKVDYANMKDFPLFKGAVRMEVTVKAGEALYLPCGWFHDVSSAESGDGHVAFNYWFHPPPMSASENAETMEQLERQRRYFELTYLPLFQE
jgi:hypothetical protein